MKEITEYLSYLLEKGITLSSINIGSDEIALSIEDTTIALKILKNNNVAILGGDILIKEEDSLKYAYQIWGDEYIFLNWFCERNKNESENEYVERSYRYAIECIDKVKEISNKFKHKCFIVLVV